MARNVTTRRKVVMSAIAWLFAILIITLTWLQFRMSRSWVYYAGGE